MIASNEYEQALLSCVLIDPENAHILLVLRPDDFYYEINRILFITLKDLYLDGITIDSLSVNGGLRDKSAYKKEGGDTFLAKMYQNCAMTSNYQYYLNMVLDYSRRRNAIKIYKKAAEQLESAGLTGDIIDEVGSDISNINTGIDTTCDIRDKDLDWITEKGVSVKTGFQDIDGTTGGLYADELILLAARPSMGKSALAMDIALNVSKTVPVLFFSLEMTTKQLGQRILSNLSGVQMGHVRSGKLTPEEVESISKAWGKFNENTTKLLINDNMFDLNQIISACKRHSRPGLIIIDYLQLIKVNSKEKRYIAVGEISRSLKHLSKQLSCPVLALSQLNRLVESRTDMIPRLSDLRESGDLEQDADMVMFLHGEKEQSKRTVIVAKNRQGRTGKVDLYFLQDMMRFENSIKEDIL